VSKSPDHFVLRDLPLPSRLVVAAFLVTVGAGYAAALVQLHFQHASAGQLLPNVQDTQQAYHGGGGSVSTIERLVEAPNGPLNGTGSMRPAFTEQSRDWAALTKNKSQEELQKLGQEREGERLALLSWVRAGSPKQSYDADEFPLSGDLATQAVTAEFLAGSPGSGKRVRIRTLFERRCVDCHGESGRDPLAQMFPLDTYERVRSYAQQPASKAISLSRLAQTTHVHLLGFAVLFGVTGLGVSLTRYPVVLRAVAAPLPLVAQVAEIACWWLCRLDPLWAWPLVGLGVVVAAGVFCQIVATLCDLFDRAGQAWVIGGLLLVLISGAALYIGVVEPHLEHERNTMQRPP
jgi:mono/diheme cytochrome c family protein